MLEFIMADGAVHYGGFKSDSGQQQPSFILEPDEHLVKIVARQGDFLSGLQFHTSKGRESIWYGGPGGTVEEFTGSSEDPIVSFERNEGGFCPKLKRVVRLQESRDVSKDSPSASIPQQVSVMYLLSIASVPAFPIHQA